MADLDADLSNAVAAPESSPVPAAAPATPAPEPSRRDVIAAAVAKQRDPSSENAPAKGTAPGDRPRAPDGKFAPGVDRPAPDRVANPAAPSAAAAPNAPPVDAAAPAAASPEAAPVVRPPPGWSPASKVAFDTLPESVKADIAKREREVDQGFAKLAKYKPVDKYLDMAERGGTTLDKALENYTGIETLLRRDVFAGVEQVLKNVGVNPLSFAQAYLQRANGQPQTPPNAQPQARQPASIDPQAIVRQATEAVRAEYEQRQVQGEIQKFAADPKNRFYENVKPAMARLVQAGLANTIQDAYDMACRMDPAISALISQPAPVDPRIAAANQARGAARATIGAPSPGNAPAARASNPNLSRREEISAAVAAQRARA